MMIQRDFFIRSDSDIQLMASTFKTDPNEVYQQLSCMPHDDLAVLAMQLLTLRTAPLVGPASSSRVGMDVVSAIGRSSMVSGSVIHVPAASVLGISGFKIPAKDCFGEESESSGPLDLVASSPSSTRKASVVHFTPDDDPDRVRAMSTHDLEATFRERHVEFEETYVPLKEIHFYQDYVCNQFMDGRFLTTTIDQLRSGAVTPESLPRIECLRYRGKWYGMGNRRLTCFHYVFRNDPMRLIPVRAFTVPDNQPFFPQGDGFTVRLGGGSVIDGQLTFSMKHCLHR